MLTIIFFNKGPKYFNFEQRLLQKLLYFNISNYIKELMLLGIEYSFYAPLILTIESTKGYFFTAPLLRFNELIKLNFNIKEFNILNSSKNKHTTNSYLNFLNLIKSFNNINAFSTSLHIMSNTKAKASWNQICQLIGIRGYLTNATGEVFKIPILNSFNKGLNLLEYFISCYGARKGILDTALKTADAGYLTRRLVESIQELVIKEYNCNSNNSFEYTIQLNNKGNIILPFFLLLCGKVLQKNLIEYKTKRILEFKFNYISENLLNTLFFNIPNSLIKINTFSIKTCLTGRTICSTCFGHTTFKTNSLGKSVGILAGQVIGEPGTQLTLRTFHTGGASALTINNSINKENFFLKTKSKYLYLFKTKKHIYKLCAASRIVKIKKNIQILPFIYLKKHYFTLNSKYLLFILSKYKLNNLFSINNRLLYNNNLCLSIFLINSLNINNIFQRKYLKNYQYEQYEYTGEFIYKNIIQLIIKNRYYNWVIINLNKSILLNKSFSANYKLTNQKVLLFKSKNQRLTKLFIVNYKSYLYSYIEFKNRFSNQKKIHLFNVSFLLNDYSYTKKYPIPVIDYINTHISQLFNVEVNLIKFKKIL